jgi:hypothetical protein
MRMNGPKKRGCTPLQRAYNDRREARTAEELMAALERMRTGKTRVLQPGYKWTKRDWTQEAGVNKGTPMEKRDDGSLKFPKAIELYEQLSKGDNPDLSTAQKLRRENTALRSENARLKRELMERDNFARRVA